MDPYPLPRSQGPLHDHWKGSSLLSQLEGIGRARLLHLGPEDATFESFKPPDFKKLVNAGRRLLQ